MRYNLGESLRIYIYVIFTILTLSSFCVAAELDSSIHTKGGDLRVIVLPGESTPDTVVFNDYRLLRVEGTYISIKKFYSFSNRDIVLISIDFGGAIDFPEYKFIVIRPGTRPTILANINFCSVDGTFKIQQKEEIIQIDLGFDEGFKKTAKLQGDTLVVTKEPVKANKAAKSIPKGHCDGLFSQVLNECVAGKVDDCQTALDHLSTASQSWINALSNNPAFDGKEFEKLCARVCATGRLPSRLEFGRRFCGAK